MNGVVYAVRTEMLKARDKIRAQPLDSHQFRSVWESVKKGLDSGGRGIVIVGAVIRKRLETD
jgi:hypothetical protein